jgi:hypothetical protein
MKPVYTAIYNALSADGSLLAELSGTPIYYSVAPQGVDRPHVIFFNAGGGPENIYPGYLTSVRFAVKGVANTFEKACDIDTAIYNALHDATLTVSGTTNIWTRREDEISVTELTDGGELIYHEGGYYRIRNDS